MHVDVVIGANYGDEGKGLVTEFCCRKSASPIVVLSNGGCQRGHTVCNAESGIRHVFHHFGSGTLLGVPSVYAKTYLLNPIKYVEERTELASAGICPIAVRAPGCVLQLPVDMFVNQQLESYRSKASTRHGSCGWGIWETQVRNAARGKPLTFCEFESLSYGAKQKLLHEEAEAHVHRRLVSNSIPFDRSVLETIMSDGFTKHFISDFEQMASQVKCLESDNLVCNDYGFNVESLIVENAQGLLLDKKYAPADENGRVDIHTTPSKCGLEGALDALGEGISISDVSTFYVSRTYLTRHGDGPFPGEEAGCALDASEDTTNVFNEYQGSIRHGRFTAESLSALMGRAQFDGHGTSWSIVLTHCNSALSTEAVQSIMHSPSTYCSFVEDAMHITKRSI